MTDLQTERQTAVHLLRAGCSVADVSGQLNRSARWVRQCRARFEAHGWSGLESRSRAPHRHGGRLPEAMRQAIVQARSELEAAAMQGQGLKYIGGPAVRTRLREKQVQPLPSVSTVERVLRERHMTRPYRAAPPREVSYPHLQPSAPHQLCQVDITPHFLTGGVAVACFNAIDVVSRYPTGQAYAQRRAQDAVAFLLHVWQTLGIARYTQVDNESCFSGGFTHPYALGQVVRLALAVGTELLFSPVRHPQSNGFVERFHQDYHRHVWQDTYLENQEAVQQRTDHFLALYRGSRHHSALQEQTPHDVHFRIAPQRLRTRGELLRHRLPLHAGAVHFLRRVSADHTIPVLNVSWSVPNAAPDTGVWTTLELTCSSATLAVFDAAPDRDQRICLVRHPFPLTEGVLPSASVERDTPSPLAPSALLRATAEITGLGVNLVGTALLGAVRFAAGLARGTMY